ncbi:MAG: hypothetical protein AAFV72_00410 [Cyanobacteria bacterium J06635_1]
MPSITTVEIDALEPLTGSEQAALAVQEQRIESATETFFITVGEALKIIRDQRLYKATYNTFEAYCQTRWGYTRDRAYKLIRAIDTYNTLAQSARVDTLPSGERQIRELDKLPDSDQRVDAWVQAAGTAEGSQPTVAETKAAVKRVQQRAQVAPGSKAVVIAGPQPKGTEVVVERTESGGSTIYATLPDGESYPFLAGEIEITEAAPPPEKKPRGMTLREQVRLLKGLLTDVLAEAAASDDLRARIREAIG